MKPYKFFLSAAATLMLLSLGLGCATSGDLERVERKVSSMNVDVGGIKGGVGDLDVSMRAEAKRSKDMQAALKSIGESQARMAAALEALEDDLAAVKRNQADLGSRMFTMAGGEITGFSGKLDEMKHGLETTNAKLDDMKAALLQRMAALEEKGAGKAPAAQGGGGDGAQGAARDAGEAGSEGQGAEGGAPAAASTADPTQLYQAAYLDYTKGSYDVAITGFREYQRSFPDGEFVGNAQYWVGESLYSLGRYEEALAEFEKVVGDYPDSTKAPGAILKEGFCYDALGRRAEARDAYDMLIKKYPGSEAAKLAAEKLKPKVRGKVPGK